MPPSFAKQNFREAHAAPPWNGRVEEVMPKKGLKARKRKDGRWEVRPYLREPDGRYRRVSVFGKTAEEALRKARELVAQHEKGLLPAKSAATLAAFAEGWLARKRATLAPKTFVNYQREVGYLLAHLGEKRLQAIRPADIREALDRMAAQGLGPRAIRKALTHLRAIFREALALEVVHRDPTASIRLEAPTRRTAGRTLEPHEVAALLQALDAWPTWEVGTALRLCLAVGLRPGEALGLKWGDLDFRAGTLAVRRAWTSLGGKGLLTAPKTPSSLRTIPVPPKTLEHLRARWEALVETGMDPLDLREAWVFPSAKDPSQPLNPHSLAHALRKIVARVGLPPIRPHDLRHTFASMLLAEGAPPEVVAARLGHARPSITLDIYRHLLAREREAWTFDPEDLVAGPRPQA